MHRHLQRKRTTVVAILVMGALWLVMRFRSGMESTRSPSHTFNPILRHMGYNSDMMYTALIEAHPKPSSSIVVLEVGVYNLGQTKKAIDSGFQIHAFDASPANFKRMEGQLQRMSLSDEARARVHFHFNAVAGESGQMLHFDSGGSTGDHVTGMTVGSSNDPGKQAVTVQVETVALDDIIDSLKAEESIYLLKVDVQGFEVNVFKGVEKAVAAGKIRYILFEYWVDAIDSMAGSPFGSCIGVNTILPSLVSAGYALFDLGIEMHPTNRLKKDKQAEFFRPLEFVDNCHWFSDRGEAERIEAHGGFTMGYWTDVLAVSTKEFGPEETDILGPIRMKR